MPGSSPGMTIERDLPAPHRRHHHFVAAAGAAVDFLPGAELQILAPADPDFAEPPACAGPRDRRTAETGLELDEGRLDGLLACRFLFRQLHEILGALHPS